MPRRDLWRRAEGGPEPLSMTTRLLVMMRDAGKVAAGMDEQCGARQAQIEETQLLTEGGRGPFFDSSHVRSPAGERPRRH